MAKVPMCNANDQGSDPSTHVKAGRLRGLLVIPPQWEVDKAFSGQDG